MSLARVRIACALLALLSMGLPLRTESREAGVNVECPARWSVAQGSVALAQTRFWFSPQVPFGPDDRTVPSRYGASVLLDCAYGSARDPSVRLTLQVQGLAQSCGESHGLRRAACQTLVLADGARPRVHVAERVGPNASLDGFVLNQDAVALAKMASAAGFHCEQDGGLTCVRGNTRVEVGFVGGKSSEVVTTRTGGADEIESLRIATIFRFGLKRSSSGADASTESWTDRDSRVSVSMPRRNDAFVLVLRSTTAR